MTKQEFVAKVSEKTGLTKKDSEIAVNGVLEALTEAMAEGEKVSFVGFGTFEVRERAERVGKNPQTGKEIKIPACNAPAFKAGAKLKEAVNSKPNKK